VVQRHRRHLGAVLAGDVVAEGQRDARVQPVTGGDLRAALTLARRGQEETLAGGEPGSHRGLQMGHEVVGERAGYRLPARMNRCHRGRPFGRRR
jgi:hypothetical protein